MKYRALNLLLSFIFLSLTAFAQTNDSTVIIKITKEKFVVSGVVQSESVKREVEEITRRILGGNTDFSRLKSQSGITPFQYLWQSDFEASLHKIKSWKSGIFVFSTNKTSDKYPPIPVEIAEAKIELSDGRIVAVKDFNNKTVVLFLIESWCGPCRNQAEVLRDFYPQIASRNVEILALGVDTSPDDKKNFRKMVKQMKLPFRYGWAEPELTEAMTKISKLNGIPQALVISNGTLRGVFAGGSPSINEKFKETMLKIADEDNLSK